MGGPNRYRVFAVLAALALTGVALDAAPAAAAAGSVTVAPAAVPAGGTVTISGSVDPAQCPASDGVTLTSTAAFFPPDGFGPVAARTASGAFSVSHTVPASTPPGSYSIGLRCGGGNVGVSATLRVSAQVSQVPSGAPQAGAGGASTSDGPDAGWVAAGAILLLVAGMASFTLWRRRRPA